MENKDYVLHINWHSHRVGTLAWVDERFYLMQRREKELKEARADGYDGIPGFDFKKNESKPISDKWREAIARYENQNDLV